MRENKLQSRVVATVEERTGEPVVTALMATAAGITGSLIGAGGVLGLVKKRQARKRAPGLPRAVFLAVTATDVLVYRCSDLLQVKEEVARWPLGATAIQVDPKGRLTRRIEVRPPDGPVVELETAVDKVNEPAVEAFIRAVGAGPG